MQKLINLIGAGMGVLLFTAVSAYAENEALFPPHEDRPEPIARTERLAQAETTPVRTISDEQAEAIAVKEVPGKVMDIEVEKKFGKKTIVVEVISDDDMEETDVIIDMQTGEVLGIEK